MRVALTGTPGTGKTTVSEAVGEALGFAVVHLSELVGEDREGLATGYDEARETHEVDVEALREQLEDHDDALFEGHLAHHLPVDHCVVLRCRPDVIAHRLRDRGYGEAKVRENAESEALDVVLAEAVELRDAVTEIDATELAPDEAAAAVADAVEEGRTGWGDVAWPDHLDGVRIGDGDDGVGESEGVEDGVREGISEGEGGDR